MSRITAYQRRIFGQPLSIMPVDALFFGFEEDVKPGVEIRQNVGLVSVTGSLVARGDGYDLSYDDVVDAIETLTMDDEVVGIIARFDSPGGMFPGMIDAARRIRALDQRKPIIAFVEYTAGSAAYMLASAARNVIVTPSSRTGSIGTLYVRVDVTKYDESMGFKYHVIAQGPRKAEGNPHIEMTDTERESINAMVEQSTSQFIKAVAAMRNISPAVIYEQESRVYFGADAVLAGLADGVGTLDEIIHELRQLAATSNMIERGGHTMQRVVSIQGHAEKVEVCDAPFEPAFHVAMARTKSTVDGKMDADKYRAIFASYDETGAGYYPHHNAMDGKLSVKGLRACIVAAKAANDVVAMAHLSEHAKALKITDITEKDEIAGITAPNSTAVNAALAAIQAIGLPKAETPKQDKETPQAEADSTEVQSVICSKDKFSSGDAAKKWVTDHGFHASKMDETNDSYRFRQFEPSSCQPGTFRSISLTDGVSAVICKQKSTSAAARDDDAQARVDEIVDLCALAGREDLAPGFVARQEDGSILSVADVRKKLRAAGPREKKDDAERIHGSVPLGGIIASAGSNDLWSRRRQEAMGKK